MEEVDTFNKFIVSLRPSDSKVHVLNLPALAQGLDKQEAMTFCAWILALSRAEREEFLQVWDTVENT